MLFQPSWTLIGEMEDNVNGTVSTKGSGRELERKFWVSIGGQ